MQQSIFATYMYILYMYVLLAIRLMVPETALDQITMPNPDPSRNPVKNILYCEYM